MVNKHRLYWSLQIGGWLLYALVQIVFSIMASEGVVPVPRRIVFFLLEALLAFALTSVFRSLINRWKWVDMSLPKLIPLVLLGVSVMAVVLYFLRIPVNLVLGRLFNPRAALSPPNLLGLSLFYAMLFFFWSVFYFTYHYFDRYNKSLKYEASMIEIELKNLKSQLNLTLFSTP